VVNVAKEGPSFLLLFGLSGVGTLVHQMQNVPIYPPIFVFKKWGICFHRPENHLGVYVPMLFIATHSKGHPINLLARRSFSEGGSLITYHLYPTPMFQNKNAHLSACSAMIISVGLPAPWPALVSMRISTGFLQACPACSAAANLKE